MFLDYIKYLFTGYKTAEMSPFVLALLKNVEFLVLIILGYVVQALYDNFSKGNYALDFATLQGYIMPGVTIVLGIILEAIRKYTNPSVSISTLQTKAVQGGNT